jgi:hypothetical protein
MLERRDERELDALADLVPRLRRGQGVLGPEPLVRERLHPDGLDQWLAQVVVGIGGRPVIGRTHPLRPALDQVEASVGGDSIEPGAKRALRLEPRQPAPGAEEGLLESVLGVIDRAQHPVAVGVELSAVRLDQRPERILIAATGSLEQASLVPRRGCRGGIHPLPRLDR